jgi:hypothetical protein
MSQAAVDETLTLLEARRYSGVISPHGWMDPGNWPRLWKLGGMAFPGHSEASEYVKEWQKYRPKRTPYLLGWGYGADLGGLSHQPDADTGDGHINYPFKSYDGRVTFDRQKTGDRVFDINTMGVAHYGLYPDWVEDLRHVAGDQIVKDLANGSEAYLEMWERAIGITPRYVCKSRRLRFTRGGLGGVAFGVSAEDELRSAGQPMSRVGRTFGYCVKGGGSVKVTFDRHGMADRISYRLGRRVRTQTRRGARKGRSASVRLLPR